MNYRAQISLDKRGELTDKRGTVRRNRDLKIIIFGLGNIYNQIKQYFYANALEIQALADNNQRLIGSLVDGYVVEDPRCIWKYAYDYVVITSNYAIEMRRQLIELGIEPEKIVHYRDYIGSLPVKNPGVLDSRTNSVLILSNDFGYHGGPIACLSLAHILRQRGYGVTIAVPSAERDFLEEISTMDLRIIVVENLAYLSMDNLEWTDAYDYIVANTIIMIRCAIKLSRKRKVYLWLHESIDVYLGLEYWKEEITEGVKSDLLIIGAVSDVAWENFLYHYKTEAAVTVMPFGIEDRYEQKGLDVIGEIVTFTIIANHALLKGVDVLLDSLNLLSTEAQANCRVLFVGRSYDNSYSDEIMQKIDQSRNCIYLGELSRERIFELYEEADVIVIPSRRETMSLVAAEAMMMKKTCIISDSVGIAKYIKHKYNALVFKNEDVSELAKMIKWCLENRGNLTGIAKNARKTYEEIFSMEKFSDRVMSVMESLR